MKLILFFFPLFLLAAETPCEKTDLLYRSIRFELSNGLHCNFHTGLNFFHMSESAKNIFSETNWEKMDQVSADLDYVSRILMGSDDEPCEIPLAFSYCKSSLEKLEFLSKEHCQTKP